MWLQLCRRLPEFHSQWQILRLTCDSWYVTVHVALSPSHHSKCYYSAHGIPLTLLIWRLFCWVRENWLSLTQWRGPDWHHQHSHALTDWLYWHCDAEMRWLIWSQSCSVNCQGCATCLRERLRLSGAPALSPCCCSVSFKPNTGGAPCGEGHLERSVNQSKNKKKKRKKSLQEGDRKSKTRWKRQMEGDDNTTCCTVFWDYLHYVFNMIQHNFINDWGKPGGIGALTMQPVSRLYKSFCV